jgi:hypothetical protein
MTDKQIRLGDLPHELLADIAETVRFSTIAFVRGYTDDPQLLGSGVLVSAGGVSAILTAEHVLDVLPTSGRLGVFLTRGGLYESIDVGGTTLLRLARGVKEADGPDLGAIVLAPSIASSIGAKKSFVDLDTRRDAVLATPPHVLNDGMWLAQGYLEEESVVERRDGGTHFFLYNFTGVGAPDVVIHAGEHDYVDFLVSYEARPIMPRSWGGMSGGGLWQVRLRDTEGEISYDRPVLAGILFYQHPTSADTCGVKGHSWRSVYDVAFSAIAKCKA